MHPELAAYIDHTLLKADATREQVDNLCNEALQYAFHSVIVHPFRLAQIVQRLEGSGVVPGTVAGFPFGTNTTGSKVYETAEAVRGGAREIDMVLNVGALKDREHTYVVKELRAVAAVCGPGIPLKVILENCLLTKEEIVTACRFCADAGVQFVKTSTGLSTGGATLDDVRLMRATVGPSMGVKAAGGIRDFATARAMIDAGANRIGTSSGVAIVTG
jgi:deoxyribose-phosphate aldolase